MTKMNKTASPLFQKVKVYKKREEEQTRFSRRPNMGSAVRFESTKCNGNFENTRGWLRKQPLGCRND